MKTPSKLKPTFQLNRTQKRLLIAKERESFIRHCKRSGWNPKDVEKKLFENFRQRDSEIVEGLRQGAKKNNFELELDSFNPLLRNKNYWQYLHWQTDMKRRMITDWICEADMILPINYGYVSKIAKMMGLSGVSEENPDSLKNFLLNVPLMNLFDLEFNAFVSEDTIIDGIPCVCVHTSLPELAEFYTNLFLCVLIPEKVQSRMQLESDKAFNHKVKSREFVWSCVSGFLALLGATTELGMVPKYQFTKIHPQLTYEFLTSLHGSSGFVGLHEFGHLLMGHLEKIYDPSLELEADAFAAKTLVNKAKDWSTLQWIALGLAITFNILEMIEVLKYWKEKDADGRTTERNPTILETHPKAEDRLAALENEIQGINLCGVGNVIKQLWIPSYRKLKEFAQTGCST